LLLVVATSACSLIYNSASLGPGDDGDASVVDATDALGESTSTPSPYCMQPLNPRPLFCEDFDQGDIKKDWANQGLNPDDPFETAGNSIQEDDAGIDGTRAVAMDFLAKGPGGTPGQAVLLKVFNAIPPRAVILMRMNMRWDTGPPTKAQGPGAVVLTLGASGGIILFRAVGGDVLGTFEGRTPGPYVQFPSLPPKKWLDVRFQIDTGGSWAGACSVDGGAYAVLDADANADADAGPSPGALLLVDGTPVACVPLPSSFAKATSATLSIGAVGGLAPVEAMHVAFDNVTVSF
jgi:hypothetical protein